MNDVFPARNNPNRQTLGDDTMVRPSVPRLTVMTENIGDEEMGRSAPNVGGAGYVSYNGHHYQDDRSRRHGNIPMPIVTSAKKEDKYNVKLNLGIKPFYDIN